MPDEPPEPERLLRPFDGEVWDEASVPLGERGVRLSWLIGFARAVWWHANARRWAALGAEDRARKQEEAARLGPWDVPYPDPVHVPEEVIPITRALVADWIISQTAASRAPLYALIPDDARGAPQRFVSHAWDSHLYSPVMRESRTGPAALINALDGNVKEEFVWIDICCYNSTPRSR